MLNNFLEIIVPREAIMRISIMPLVTKRFYWLLLKRLFLEKCEIIFIFISKLNFKALKIAQKSAETVEVLKFLEHADFLMLRFPSTALLSNAETQYDHLKSVLIRNKDNTVNRLKISIGFIVID